MDDIKTKPFCENIIKVPTSPICIVFCCKIGNCIDCDKRPVIIQVSDEEWSNSRGDG